MTTTTESSVPLNNKDLVIRDSGFIQAVLNRIDRGSSKDDVYQHVILKLIEADVLGKFNRMVAAKLPLVMSADEACEVLGIKFPQWRSRQHAYRFGVKKAAWGGKVWRSKWAPDPVDATGEPVPEAKGYAGHKTLYLTLDIIRLYEEKGFRCLHFVPKPVEGPTVSAAQWRGYLRRAVHNHWANYCRTQSRRHKERPVAPAKSVNGDEVDSTVESMLSFEDSIEARVDLHRLQHAAGHKTTAKGLDFLDLVNEGYTGVEAMEKLGYTTRQAQRQLHG